MADDETASWPEDAEVLAGPTDVELEDDTPAYLVRRDDGRLGLASDGVFRPLGAEGDLRSLTVNAGSERGTAVLALAFEAGEVRTTVDGSAAATSRDLRELGYTVSAKKLGPAGDPLPEADLERPEQATAPIPVRSSPPPAEPPTRQPATAPAAPAAPAESTASTEPAEPAEKKPNPLLRVATALGFAGRGVLSLLRSLVLLVGTVVAAILVIYVILVLTKANPDNSLVRFFDDISKPLAWKFKDLFTPRTRRANIAENYLVAAVVYFVVASIVATFLQRLRGSGKR